MSDPLLRRALAQHPGAGLRVPPARDLESEAVAVVSAAMEPLTLEQRERVLRYLQDRFKDQS